MIVGTENERAIDIGRLRRELKGEEGSAEDMAAREAQSLPLRLSQARETLATSQLTSFACANEFDGKHCVASTNPNEFELTQSGSCD